MDRIFRLKVAAEVAAELQALLEAKKESDRKNYARKAAILRELIRKNPESFLVDSEQNNTYGLTHKPTNFRIHMLKSQYPQLLRDKS